MKICLVNATDTGGAGIACLRLYRALKKAGFDVKVVLQKARLKSSVQNPDFTVLVNNPWQKGRYYLRHLREKKLVPKGMENFVSSGKTGLRVKDIKAIKEADIIHYHWINDSFLKVEHMFKTDQPAVWTFHDMWPLGFYHHYFPDKLVGEIPNDYLNQTLYKKMKEQYREHPPYVISPSNWLSKLAVQSNLYSPDRVRVIGNPLDCELFKPDNAARDRWRSTLNIPSNRRIGLFGSFNVLGEKRKGFSELLEALHSLDSRNPGMKDELEIAVIGRPDQQLAAEVPFKIHFMGFMSRQEQLAQAYNVADFFVIPSLQDNLPNMCLEAIASGLPVVGFDTGGVSDMAKDGENGFLAECGNAGSLSMAIERLIAKDSLADFAECSRKHALQHYRDNVVAEKFIDLYREMLAN